MRSSTVGYMLAAAGLASATSRGLPFMFDERNGTDIPFPFPNNTVPLLPNATLPNGTFPNATFPFPNGTVPLPPNATFPNATTPLPNGTHPVPGNGTDDNLSDTNGKVKFEDYVYCMTERTSCAQKCPRPAWHLSTNNTDRCAKHPAATYKCVDEDWVQLYECQKYMYQGGPLCVLNQFVPDLFYRWAAERDQRLGGGEFRFCMSHRATIEEACPLPRSLLKERTHRCYVYDVPGAQLPAAGCWDEEMLEYHLCDFYRKEGGAHDCLSLWPGNSTVPVSAAGALVTSPVEPNLDAYVGRE